MSEQLHPIGPQTSIGAENHGYSSGVLPMGDDDANNPNGAKSTMNGNDTSQPIVAMPIEKWVDLGERMVRLEERFGHLSSQVEQLPDRAEVNANIQSVKEEVNASIQSVKEEIYAEIKSLRDDMDAKFQAQDANIDKLTESVVRLEETVKHLATNEAVSELKENQQHLATKKEVAESEARIMVAIAESKAAAARNNLYLIIAIMTLALTIAGSAIAVVSQITVVLT